MEREEEQREQKLGQVIHSILGNSVTLMAWGREMVKRG